MSNSEQDLPTLHDSYDFSGDGVMKSNIVNTNKGVAVYVKYDNRDDGGWVTVSWDSSEAGRPIKGVTKWEIIEYLE